MTPIDNPLNGYYTQEEDEEYLGMFLLSPRAITISNNPPHNQQRYWWLLTENRFIDWDIADTDIYQEEEK